MTPRLLKLAPALLLCAAAHAATFTTTITINATAGIDLSSGGFKISGTTNMTGGIGAGSIVSNIPASAIATNPVVSDFTITVTSGGTITGKLSTPSSVLTGGATPSATVTMTVTGGTGTYAGATSPAISLTGSVSGSLATGFTLSNFTGSGTITTGGTGGGGGTGSTVTVTDVLDAGSYTKNIAQGSIFVVKGTGLSASGFTQFQFPLPSTSAGVKITFTPVAGGAGTDAYLVYLYNQGGVNQLAAVLPSTVATGNYNLTVTNGASTSTPVQVQVVQRKLGLITADGSGSGLAVIQNYISSSQLDIDRFTTFASSGYTFSPSKPGQVLIAWATGMGPVTGGDNVASPGFDFNANGVNVKVIVGGVSITPLYAGRAPGLAGADQINFQLPANIPTGCTVSFQVSVNGTLSNPSFIAIAPSSSASACVAPGYTTDQLKNFDNGGTISTGALSLSQFQITVPQIGSAKSNSVGASFTKLSGFQLSSAGQGSVSSIQQDSCTVITATSGGTDTGSGNVTYLDAGVLTITGPSGSNLSNTTITKNVTAPNRPAGPVINYGLTNFEGISLPGQTNFSLPGGTYTINGAGGTDVGSFSASITTGSPLTVTGGLPSTVNRSQNLPISWTGGNPTDFVEIIGGTSSTTGTGTTAVTTSTTFVCLTTAGKGTFTVPSSILSQLQATTATNPGSLEVASGVIANFTAPLKAGGNLDVAAFTAFVGTGATPTYQ